MDTVSIDSLSLCSLLGSGQAAVRLREAGHNGAYLPGVVVTHGGERCSFDALAGRAERRSWTPAA